MTPPGRRTAILGFITHRLRFMEPIAPRLTAFQLMLHTGTGTLVESLDLRLEPDTVPGILGANGAGKLAQPASAP